MGHSGSTHPSTARSILRSYSLFLNIGIIGRQSLLQKGHLGENITPHMKTSKGLPASLWLNTATLRLRQSQQVLSPPWRATNIFAVLGLNFKSHLVGIALVHQKSLPLPTETHLDCILQEESISIRAPYYGGGWDEDMKGKPYLRDKSVEECIELVCNCALLGSQNSPQPLSLLSS